MRYLTISIGATCCVALALQVSVYLNPENAAIADFAVIANHLGSKEAAELLHKRDELTGIPANLSASVNIHTL